MECRLDVALLEEVLVAVRGTSRLRDIATRVHATRDDVEAALIHLVNRGQLVRQKPKRRASK